MYRDESGVCGTVGKFLTSYAKLKYGAGVDNVYNVSVQTWSPVGSRGFGAEVDT